MKVKEVKKKDLRQFGIVLGFVLGLVGAIHFLKGHTNVYPWFLGAAGIALLLGVFMPWLLKPVFHGFTRVAHAIGWFNTRVILTLVYYVILTPIGLLMKVFRKDPLDRRVGGDAESYWIKRADLVAVKESLEKQF